MELLHGAEEELKLAVLAGQGRIGLDRDENPFAWHLLARISHEGEKSARRADFAPRHAGAIAAPTACLTNHQSNHRLCGVSVPPVGRDAILTCEKCRLARMVLA